MLRPLSKINNRNLIFEGFGKWCSFSNKHGDFQVPNVHLPGPPHRSADDPCDTDVPWFFPTSGGWRSLSYNDAWYKWEKKSHFCLVHFSICQAEHLQCRGTLQPTSWAANTKDRVTWSPKGKIHLRKLTWLLEKQPFEDVSPIKKWQFFHCHVSFIGHPRDSTHGCCRWEFFTGWVW